MPAHDLLEPLRQLAADRDAARPAARRRASAASPAAAAATRRRRPAAASARAPPTASRAPSRRAAGTRGTGSARPTSPLATSAVSTADGPGSTVTGTPALERGGDQPRARVVDPRQARVADERDPLARLEPRQELRRPRRLVVLVVAEQPRARCRAARAAPRVRRVSSQRTTSASRSSREHAERDVVEVADRRRADARARGPQDVDARTRASPAPTRPASAPELGRARSEASRPPARAPRAAPISQRRAEQQLARGRAEAAADHDELRLEHVHERADPRAEHAARSRRAPRAPPRRPPARARRARASPRAGPEPCARAGRPPCPRRPPRDDRGPCRRPGTAAPSRDDHDVAELGPAAVEPAVEHQRRRPRRCRA